MAHDFKPSRRELRRLLQAFRMGLQELTPADLAPSTPCPDSWTLASYVAGTLEDKGQKVINAHIAFCDKCFEEYVALAGPERVAQILMGEEPDIEQKESASADWGEWLQTAKRYVIDLGKKYGPGALVGSVRIVEEQAAFAVRGGELPKFASKVLEIQVGGNKYTLAVGISKEGAISCDLAGLTGSLSAPLHVRVQSGEGEELVSRTTDAFGNSNFFLSAEGTTVQLYLFTFTLEQSELRVFIRVPELRD